jgi:transposase
MGSRRKFTREFKRKVVQELDSRPVEELCREYELTNSLIYRWKREFNTNPHESFSGNGKIWKESAKIAKYERLIGQLYAENELLKKSIALQTRLKEEERRKRRCIE